MAYFLAASSCPPSFSPGFFPHHIFSLLPLCIKFRSVVTLCDISYNWISLCTVLRSQVYTSQFLHLSRTACLDSTKHRVTMHLRNSLSFSFICSQANCRYNLWTIFACTLINCSIALLVRFSLSLDWFVTLLKVI